MKRILTTLLLAALLAGCAPAAPAPTPTPEPTPAATPAPTPMPTPEPTPQPTPEPTPTPLPPREWRLSFAGDCTIGTLHQWQGSAGAHNMLHVIGENYAYPFQHVAEIFRSDDFTMVNFEGTLTDATDPVAKEHRFRAPPEYAQVLPLGGIDAVTLANNHSGDYREQGREDTRAALDAQGIVWADNDTVLTVPLEDGLTLGIMAMNLVEIDLNVGDVEGYLLRVQPLFAQLEESDLQIAFLHWGWEYTAGPEEWERTLAHALADMGFDLIIGSHSHVLHETEIYNGVPICYCLGNFCYGGHSAPKDSDSAIVQFTVTRDERGIRIGEPEPIPCSISSRSDRNAFCPTPYPPESDEWLRVMEKLKCAPPQ